MFSEAALAERAVDLLDPSEMLEAPLDRFVEFRRHLLRKRRVLSTIGARRFLTGRSRLLGRLRGLLHRRGLRVVLWPKEMRSEGSCGDGKGNFTHSRRGRGNSVNHRDRHKVEIARGPPDAGGW
jgi:hypothetical protein